MSSPSNRIRDKLLETKKQDETYNSTRFRKEWQKMKEEEKMIETYYLEGHEPFSPPKMGVLYAKPL
jgi:hypothetical protein